MKKYILIYGVIAGLIVICSMLVGIMMSDGEGLGASMAVGFLIMFLAFTLIFFGVRKYRDQEQGGVISFKSAFLMGLGIAAVAGVMYVLVWEIYLANTGHQFIHDYAASNIADKEAAGLSGEELAAFKTKMADMVENYARPLYRVPMTFSEIFPVGALFALVSSFILRHPKRKAGA
jgi:hypothetical protein